MTAGPVHHALQDRSFAAIGLAQDPTLTPREPNCQGRGFLTGEVLKLDPTANVERSNSRIVDEVRRRRHANQAEGQATESWLLGAHVVEMADRCEEVIG